MTANASRVTLDFDAYAPRWRFKALRAWYTLQRLAADVEVRVSSSGEGIHMIGWFDEELSEERKMELRMHLGDDPDRIRLDEQRGEWGHVTQVLWSSKGSGESDADFERVQDALDYIEVTGPSMYDRMKEFVNKGRKAYARNRHPEQG